jgi:protein-disulfide isomerase
MAKHKEVAVTKIEKNLIEKLSSRITPIGLVAVIIVASAAYLFGAMSNIGGGTASNYPSADAVKNSALNYIKSDLVDSSVSVTLLNFSDQGILYSMKVRLAAGNQSQTYTFYVTKDGKDLFASEPYILKTATAGAKSDLPVFQLFVMSFCPFGQQAENALYPVINLLGSKITVETHFIVSKNGGTYESLHGIQELQEDVRQMCISQLYGADKFWNYVETVNSECARLSTTSTGPCLANISNYWLTAAALNGINTTEVQQCVDQQGNALLDSEAALTAELSVPYSPYVIINDQVYKGQLSAEAYKTAVCDAFNTAPAECSQALSSTAGTASGSCS